MCEVVPLKCKHVTPERFHMPIIYFFYFLLHDKGILKTAMMYLHYLSNWCYFDYLNLTTK